MNGIYFSIFDQTVSILFYLLKSQTSSRITGLIDGLTIQIIEDTKLSDEMTIQHVISNLHEQIKTQKTKSLLLPYISGIIFFVHQSYLFPF